MSAEAIVPNVHAARRPENVKGRRTDSDAAGWRTGKMPNNVEGVRDIVPGPRCGR